MHGYINFKKESGDTSNKTLNKIKRILNIQKAGFLGTLDPCATGVLPIGIGFGTRFFPFFENTPKTYLAEIVFGSETDTQDFTGTVIRTGPADKLTQSGLDMAIKSFLGEIEQLPPMFSAKRIGGKRLYDMARDGKEVERDKKRVNIFAADLINFSGKIGTFRVKVSTGTYIRTLCEDIGRKLDIPAHMGNLVRETSHIFNISDSITLDELEGSKASPEKWLLPLDFPLSHLQAHELMPNDVRSIKNGVAVNWHGEPIDFLRLYDESKRFIGIGQVDPVIRKILPHKIVQ